MEVIKGRMYDYNNGRFLSVDPFIVDPSSTQALNPYTYIFNNPLSGTDPTGYKAKLEDEVAKSTTKRVAPTGSNIKSGTKTSGTTTSGDNFSITSFGGEIASTSGIDFTTSRGASTQTGKDGSISGTGGQSTRVQQPVILGEDPETGENLGERGVRWFVPGGDFAMTAAKGIAGQEDVTTGDLVKKAAFAGLEFWGSKVASSLLSKVPGFRWLAKFSNPNKSLVSEMNNMRICSGTDCSEIAEDLLRFAGGKGKILSVKGARGSDLKLLEYGEVSGGFKYHQVYTDGKFVYDPRLSAEAVQLDDWIKQVKKLNPGAVIKKIGKNE